MPPKRPAKDPSADPTGGFQWRDRWTGWLPVVRGVHVPDEPEALLEVAITLPPGRESDRGWQMARSAKRAWSYWTPDESRTRITPEALAQRDLEWWLELALQCLCHGPGLRAWPMRQCVALHGPDFGVELLMALADIVDIERQRWSESWPQLRRAIALADAAAYDAAEQTAARLRNGHPGRMLHASYLFPHRQDWTSECLATSKHVHDERQMIALCVMTPEEFVPFITGSRNSFNTRAGALLQIRVHGEAAFELARHYVRTFRSGRWHPASEVMAMGASFQLPAMPALLAEDLSIAPARKELEKLAKDYPVAVRRVLGAHVDAEDPVGRAWVRDMVGTPGSVGAPAPAPAAAPVLAETPGLPELLRQPPWLAKERQRALPVLSVATRLTEEKIALAASHQEEAARHGPSPRLLQEVPASGFHARLGLTAEGAARVLTGQPLQDGDVVAPAYPQAVVDMVLAAPPAARLALWNSYPPSLWAEIAAVSVRKLLIDHGVAAIPGLALLARSAPASVLELIGEVDSPQLVEPALQAMRHQRRARALGQAWVARHPCTTLFQALPVAFQPAATKARDNARHGIRWLVGQDGAAMAREVAAAYGPAMAGALEALLAQDPLLALPSRMPALPEFAAATGLTPPLLADGTPMPPSAVGHALTMLALSRIEAPYAGLDTLKRCCTRASLAEFAWSLFQAWFNAGAPARENWAFTSLGLLGDDETARRLAPLLRQWPSAGASARAIAGLDLMEAIGSDVALTYLDHLATTARTAGLREKARQKIEAIAEARDLTAEQLADRLVPRLGLDAAGGAELDFGPRKFSVHFDEALAPFVKDAAGIRLKDLPKPLKSDDPVLAQTATARFKELRQDAKVIAVQQVAHLERAMVARRRWTAAEFDGFILRHPLMRHLAMRLVWAQFDTQGAAKPFRVADDLSLSDGADMPITLPEDALVGIAHPLDLAAADLRAFGQLFSDYEIQQPFAQLARETFALSDSERASDLLTRFDDRSVGTASVLDLTRRGWHPIGAGRSGWISELARPLGPWLVQFHMDPGTMQGNPLQEPRQRIQLVRLLPGHGSSNAAAASFGMLDPVQASELIRDLQTLAAAPAIP